MMQIGVCSKFRPPIKQPFFWVMKFGTAVNKVVGAQIHFQPCLQTHSIWTAGTMDLPLRSAVDLTNRKALSNCVSFNVCSSKRWKCGRGIRQALFHCEDGRTTGTGLQRRAAIFKHLEDEIARAALVARTHLLMFVAQTVKLQMLSCILLTMCDSFLQMPPA